jgi:hypothetical protein
MSTYDDASLVLVPSGYKNGIVFSQKPMDANGQLTFTRASSATRVQSDGLIEKVRTNLLLQSNSFDTTWGNIGTSDTGGQSGYDGTNNAWLLDITGNIDSQRIVQSISASGSLTLSVYAKAGTKNWTRLFCSGTITANAYFDLQNGALGTATNCTSKIESAGNGYYRCSISFNTTITDARIYVATADNNISQTSGNILIQAAQLETSDIATDYIATTTAAVSVGPVSGLPRLDYLNSTCPRLLLEPQRTNLALFSEQMDNAAYSKDGVTASANAAISPDGYQSADAIVENTSNSGHRIFYASGISGTGSSAYSFSVYVKKIPNQPTRHILWMCQNSANAIYAHFNMTTFTVNQVTSNGTGSGASASITSVGNDWYRLTLSGVVSTTTATYTNQLYFETTPRTGFSTESYTGNGTSGFYVWGWQQELGAYSSSYINTLSTSVTRVADSAFKTSATAIIGQTEGTLFAEVDFTDTNADQMYLTLSDGTTNNRIHIGFDNASNWLYCNVRASGAAQGLITSSAPTSGVKKIAVGYKLNDYVLYINGVQVGVDSSALVPACTRVDVGGYFSAGFEYPVNQALLFKTRLTNQQLQELTSL